MCGICGIAGSRQSDAELERRVRVMRDTMRVRGPDDAGSYAANAIALGVRRLSILDLSPAGHMPMWSADGRFAIVHNGEIFNFLELRALLEHRGVRFRSRSDTEVLVELYAREGAAMLPRLNGLFAFAIWDAQDRSLFITRDRLGIKPLCYARHEGEFLFASEPKALFSAGLPKQFDEGTWEELLCFRFTAGERTPLVGVKRLRPGHWIRWKDGEVTMDRWWDLSRRASRPEPDGASDTWFASLFDDAVALERISDVPVGVLLSGGLDSGAVAASLASTTREHTATFTVRFPERAFDEGDIAREVAAAWDLRAHELAVAPESLLAHLSAASVLRDEPLAHSNEVHLWRISALAKPSVTVLLSGEGADETMGGYVRYQPLRFLNELFEARRPLAAFGSLPLSRRLRKLLRFLALGAPEDLVIFNACEVLPGELRALGMDARGEFPARREFLEESMRLYPDEPVRQAMYMDQHAFLCSELDRNDRMTMGASIECRVPFLDYRLVEGLASMPSSELFTRFRGKAILRRTSGSRLPPRVLTHRKWGFGVPWSSYLREVPELRQLVGMLPGLEPIKSGPFMRNRVRAAVDAFLRGDPDPEPLVFQLAMIAIWYDAYIKG